MLFFIPRKAVVLFLSFFALFLSVSAYGQIAMRISLSQKNYLLYEPIYVRIDMRNVSGNPIIFGKDKGLAGELEFTIVSVKSGDYVPPRSGKKPAPTGVILQPGAIKSFTCNLSQYYHLFRQGNFKLTAIISHPRMPNSYRSNTLDFSITKGKKIWEAAIGIPGDAVLKNPNRIPTRKYSVLSYNNGKRDMYVMMIEDDKKLYSLRHLGYNYGQMLHPQCAVDNASQLHIIIAGSPKVYSYCVFDYRGKLVKSEVRLKTSTTPHLAINTELGNVVLVGGRKALKDKDYEEIRDIPFMRGIFENKKTSVRRSESTLFDDVDEVDDRKRGK